MTLEQKAALLRELVSQAGTILLTGPAEVDGDSIGASLALALFFARFSTARIDIAGEPGHRYDFLPGAAGMLPNDRIAGPYDLAIVVDGERRRLDPHVAHAYEHARHRAIIDHHRSTSPEGYDLAFVDASAASTTQIVHRIVQALGGPLDRDLASLLYVGLVYDTGGFRHSNTTPETHDLAATLLGTGVDHTGIHIRTLVERKPRALALMARVLVNVRYHADGQVLIGTVPLALAAELGTDHADLEGIIDMLIYTEGVEAAVLAVERDEGVKLSMRSRGNTDVAALARRLDPTGGGHMRAAGVMLHQALDQILTWLPDEVARAICRSQTAVQ